MKKKTKAEKFAGLAAVVQHLKTGEPIKVAPEMEPLRTKPAVPCADVLEHVVQEECCKWLKKHGVYGHRSNVGTGTLVTSSNGLFQNNGGIRRYGIKDAGDWLGLLPDGKHLEVEFKRGCGGTLSVGQQKRMATIRKNNGYYFVIHGVPELEITVGRLLRELRKQTESNFIEELNDEN